MKTTTTARPVEPYTMHHHLPPCPPSLGKRPPHLHPTGCSPLRTSAARQQANHNTNTPVTTHEVISRVPGFAHTPTGPQLTQHCHKTYHVAVPAAVVLAAGAAVCVAALAYSPTTAACWPVSLGALGGCPEDLQQVTWSSRCQTPLGQQHL